MRIWDRKDTERYKAFSRRAVLLGGATCLAFGGLVMRLYQLQVEQSDQYRMLAEENRISVRLIPPLRGRVLDRFGEELANNRQNFRVLLVAEDSPDVAATLDRLGKIIDLDEAQRERVLREVRRRRAFVPVPVVDNIDWQSFARINFLGPDLPGIHPDVGETRHYPHHDILAHIVGYVGAVQERDLEEEPGERVLNLPGFRVGRSGVERTLDRRLRGVAGTSRVEVNAGGRVIRELARNDATPGEDAVLTLDFEIQRAVTERLSSEYSASAVVLDVHNGDVLALVSHPAFDPNLFNVGISRDAWRELNANPYKPLTNKAIAGTYPPGSTFKMVVALAALEAGVIRPEERIHCSGKVTLGTHDFHCWRRHGHGPMNMHDSIKHSCDVYYYEVARRLGVDRIHDMAVRFGLGQTFDFEVQPERAGLVPSRGWKLATTGVPWQGGETLITGIGQGFLLSNPLQLAVMTARLVNGGHAVHPHLIRSIGAEPWRAPPHVGPMGIPQAHLDIVKRSMDAVTNEIGGTAYMSRLVGEGMSIGGKTGTSQVRRITRAEREAGIIANEDLPWNRRDHALFVGYGPVDAPRYAVSVLVEHGGGGARTAAPIARDIMAKVLERDPANRPAIPPVSRPLFVQAADDAPHATGGN